MSGGLQVGDRQGFSKIGKELILTDSDRQNFTNASSLPRFYMLKPGTIVRHFKRKDSCSKDSDQYIYVVLGTGRLTESEELCVIYQNPKATKIWVRPAVMFMSEVDWEKYPTAQQDFRFEPVGYLGEGDYVDSLSFEWKIKRFIRRLGFSEIVAMSFWDMMLGKERGNILNPCEADILGYLGEHGKLHSSLRLDDKISLFAALAETCLGEEKIFETVSVDSDSKCRWRYKVCVDEFSINKKNEV